MGRLPCWSVAIQRRATLPAAGDGCNIDAGRVRLPVLVAVPVAECRNFSPGLGQGAAAYDLSLMEKTGVPISIVSKWAGHYDAALTMRTYVHASDDDLKQGRQPLAKIHKTA